LQELLAAGNVRFRFYDARRYRRQYAAETRFKIEYSTQSRFRWQATRSAVGTSQLVVRPNFDDIQFTVSHEILLPADFATDQIFANPLVRHEFDHVRISTDLRFRDNLVRWLKRDLQQIRVDLNAGAPRGKWGEIAHSELRRQTDSYFQKMIELVQIRYAELDRTTDHGTSPLPPDFFPGVLAVDPPVD
jgi:hypothetical protein